MMFAAGALALALAAAFAAARADDATIFLDTHLDTPVDFARPGWNIMERHSVEADGSQVDYPRMVQGGLNGGFWAIFTRQGPLSAQGYGQAYAAALQRALQIRTMVAASGGYFALALKADDAASIVAAGKRVVFISIENSYPLGLDPNALKAFYLLGVRMAGPVHESNNQFADSSTDPHGPRWHGLSPAGRALIAQANALGIILDASHASDETFDAMIAASKTPIVLSHTSCRALVDHPRNIDDERIRRLAAAGGVIQVNAVNEFLTTVPIVPERDTALAAIKVKYGPTSMLTSAAAAAMMAEVRAVDRRYPIPRATFDDFMNELLHAIRTAGVDHVGVGADWDGGGGVLGMNDAADLGLIAPRLRSAGYSGADIRKLESGNILRVLRAVEAFARTEAAAPHIATISGQ
jgi:membrane dipeptidase